MALENENSQKLKKTKRKDKREEAVLSAVDLNEVEDGVDPRHDAEEMKKSKKRKKETNHKTHDTIPSVAAERDGDGSFDGSDETKDEHNSKKGKKGRKDERGQPIADAAGDHEGDAGARGEPEKERKSKKGKKEKRANLGQSIPISASEESKVSGSVDTGRDLGDERKAKKKKKTRKDKWGQPIASVTEEHDGGVPAKTVRSPSKLNHGTEWQAAKTHQYEPKKVVISGMPYTTTEDEIRDLFKDVGAIVQMQLSRFPDSGNFRGLAFITFQNDEIAVKALELDGSKMGNRFVKVERCRRDPRSSKNEFSEEPPKVEGCYSVYVGNLSWEVTEEDIRNFFCDSKIEAVRLAVNKKTGQFRGFCHVDFTDDESLELAISKNQTELQGRKVKVSYAASNKD